jgi:hypothetical protein
MKLSMYKKILQDAKKGLAENQAPWGNQAMFVRLP